MKFSHVLFTILIAALTSIAVFYGMGAGKSGVAAENTFARVMRTHTLRCGYHVWPPYLVKDVNDGHFSGLYYDYVEKLAASLNLKVQWAEEVGYGDLITSLENGRIDAFCSLLWPNAARAQKIDFTQPFFYLPMYAYVRTGDTRFDKNLNAINQPDIIVSTMEGTNPAYVKQLLFPKAKETSLPQLAENTQMYLDVVAKKADVVLGDPVTAKGFMDKNPGTLQQISLPYPLRMLPNVLGVARGEYAFAKMLDNALQDMQDFGSMDMLLNKYDPDGSVFWRVREPYKAK